MKIIVTGGLGFIGSNFIKYIINKKEVNWYPITCFKTD